MPKRQGNNPKRRISPKNLLSEQELNELIRVLRYEGSSLHKRFHADYGLEPPANPRRNKSLCDGKRSVRQREAIRLFRSGLKRGMMSTIQEGEPPKYVWAVDEDGEAYEAKLGGDGRSYHGYRLGDDERMMKQYVISEWKQRCPSH